MSRRVRLAFNFHLDKHFPIALRFHFPSTHRNTCKRSPCNRVVVFVIYLVITLGLLGFALIRMFTSNEIVLTLLRAIGYIFYALAPMANLVFFFLVSHTLCLSYDDWTAKMLAASEKSLLSVPKVMCLISASHARFSA